jgi:glutathione synthase/RimK-type ligase-like ATP-grasp enzyme
MATARKLDTTELLFRCAKQMGLMPVWIAPLDTFAIMVNGREMYINHARSPLNSATSVSLAKNKYITRRILERHNMPNIPYTLPRTNTEADAFLARYGTIIAKPVTGAGAHDIHIISHKSELAALKVERYILEKYTSGKELRYLVLNNKVIGVHRSEYGSSVAEDRPLQRISYPQDLWSPALLDLSLKIADTLSLKFAAVDYLIDASGYAYILEVNTMPGLKWFHAPTSGPIVDVARLFLESIIDNEHPDELQTPGLLTSSPALAYS